MLTSIELYLKVNNYTLPSDKMKKNVCEVKRRLNNLMILHIHSDVSDQLNLTCVAEEFVGHSEHRLSVFGRYQ